MREMGEKVTDLFKSFHLEKITGEITWTHYGFLEGLPGLPRRTLKPVSFSTTV